MIKQVMRDKASYVEVRVQLYVALDIGYLNEIERKRNPK